MSIMPVSSFNTNTISFGQGKHNNSAAKPQSTDTNTGLKYIIPAMMFMIPVGAAAAKNSTHIAEASAHNVTVVSAPDEKAEQPSTYYISPETTETEQANGPYGYASLKNEKILYEKNFTSRNRNYVLLFTSSEYSNMVTNVYIIQQGDKGSANNDVYPGEVKELIRHTGEKEFCEAKVRKDIIDPMTSKYNGEVEFGLELPDDVAQKVVNLVKRHSEFGDNTEIPSEIRTTNNPGLTPIKKNY